MTERHVLTVRADEVRPWDLVAWGGTPAFRVTSLAQMKPDGNVFINSSPAFHDADLEMAPGQRIRIEREVI